MTKPASALHPIPQSRLRGRDGRPDMVAVGTIIWLASELMFFAALFAAYFTIRNVTNSQAAAGYGDAVGEPDGAAQYPVRHRQHHRPGGEFVHLPDGGLRGRARSGHALRFAAGHPAVGPPRVVRADLPHGLVLHRRPDLRVRRLFSENLTISTNVYGSVFFLATGFHGLHVTGGLIAFMIFMGRTFLARTFTHEQAVSAVVVSYYWHFVDVVWIALFGVIYILK